MAKLNGIALVSGGVWATPNASIQPVITLARWRVMEIQGGPRAKERILVGYNCDDGEGRVSTAIIGFDVTVREFTTASGRKYILAGPSGYDADGEYVWQRWVPANHATDTRDVSSEYCE